VIVTLSSSEQSRFISCIFHQRFLLDRDVYVRKHPNSAHAKLRQIFLRSGDRRAMVLLDWPPAEHFGSAEIAAIRAYSDAAPWPNVGA
jgi:hypothetical protein